MQEKILYLSKMLIAEPLPETLPLCSCLFSPALLPLAQGCVRAPYTLLYRFNTAIRMQHGHTLKEQERNLH